MPVQFHKGTLAPIEVIGSSDAKAERGHRLVGGGSKKWPSIEVIGSAGEKLGVMTAAEDLCPAREQGLDLPVTPLLSATQSPIGTARAGRSRRRARE